MEPLEFKTEPQAPITASQEQIGQFGWEEIDNISVPFLIRSSGEKYVEKIMLENTLFKNYCAVFTHEVFQCATLPFYKMTPVERYVLNEINATHCDCAFIKRPYNEDIDVLIKMDDVLNMCKFLKTCGTILLQKKFGQSCGFVKMANETPVPFVTDKENTDLLVPLFFFDFRGLGELVLSLKDPWKLACLKLCCKILSIKEHLYDLKEIKVIPLIRVRKLFPDKTDFNMLLSIPSFNSDRFLKHTMVLSKDVQGRSKYVSIKPKPVLNSPSTNKTSKYKTTKLPTIKDIKSKLRRALSSSSATTSSKMVPSSVENAQLSNGFVEAQNNCVFQSKSPGILTNSSDIMASSSNFVVNAAGPILYPNDIATNPCGISVNHVDMDNSSTSPLNCSKMVIHSDVSNEMLDHAVKNEPDQLTQSTGGFIENPSNIAMPTSSPEISTISSSTFIQNSPTFVVNPAGPVLYPNAATNPYGFALNHVNEQIVVPNENFLNPNGAMNVIMNNLSSALTTFPQNNFTINPSNNWSNVAPNACVQTISGMAIEMGKPRVETPNSLNQNALIPTAVKKSVQYRRLAPKPSSLNRKVTRSVQSSEEHAYEPETFIKYEPVESEVINLPDERINGLEEDSDDLNVINNDSVWYRRPESRGLQVATTEISREVQTDYGDCKYKQETFEIKSLKSEPIDAPIELNEEEDVKPNEIINLSNEHTALENDVKPDMVITIDDDDEDPTQIEETDGVQNALLLQKSSKKLVVMQGNNASLLYKVNEIPEYIGSYFSTTYSVLMLNIRGQTFYGINMLPFNFQIKLISLLEIKRNMFPEIHSKHLLAALNIFELTPYRLNSAQRTVLSAVLCQRGFPDVSDGLFLLYRTFVNVHIKIQQHLIKNK